MRSPTPIAVALSATFALLAPGPEARAEHGDPLLLVKPGSGAEIPRNAVIRLVSYNGEDELIRLLGRSPLEARVTLESARAAVALRPRRYLPDFDGYGRAMIALAPDRLLEPETEYRLIAAVPSAGWREELAAFRTTGEVDRVAPGWASAPVLDREARRFVGRPAEIEGLIEVGLTVRPRGGGRARRTFILFDLEQECIGGPTADYDVAIFNSQCIDGEERSLEGAVCDALYYFPGWRRAGAAYDVFIELRDLAGNVRKRRAPAGRVDLDAPVGVCLALGPGAQSGVITTNGSAAGQPAGGPGSRGRSRPSAAASEQAQPGGSRHAVP